MSLLDIDSIISIFSLLTTNVLVKQRGVCKFFKNIISENIKSFNINVSGSKITDYQLKQVFTNCRIINLNNCYQITDNGLKHLIGVHTIDLRYHNQITDNGLKHLIGVHTINLRYCNQITDNGLKYLINVRTIHLNECNQITNNGRKYLKNIGATVFG
jgi:hypothetical protein